MDTRVAYGTGSGVQEATASWTAMRHRIAAVTTWSRFDTPKTMDWTTMGAPERIYRSLRQGPRRP